MPSKAKKSFGGEWGRRKASRSPRHLFFVLLPIYYSIRATIVDTADRVVWVAQPSETCCV